MDIGERGKRKRNLQGEFVYDEHPVTSKSTHQLSASELQATGGGTLEAFETARLETSPESAWAPGIQRLLDQVRSSRARSACVEIGSFTNPWRHTH